MRIVLLTIVLIGLVNSIYAEEVKINWVNRCPRTCDCTPTYIPVCGASGKTHSNACMAKCFNDKVVAKGACKLKKCSEEKTTKKTKCRQRAYGRNGRRRQCCVVLTKGKKVLQRTCSWVGCAHYRNIRRSSKWVKRNGWRLKKNCKWTETRCGKKKKVTGFKCTFGKKKYKTFTVGGCNLRPYGRCGKRIQCCYRKKHCVNNKCRYTKNKCSFKGGYKNTYVKERCVWSRRTHYSKQRRCCKYRKVCTFNARGKKVKCTKTVRSRCRWTGRVVVAKRVKKCKMQKFGRFGRRKRCCEFHYNCAKKHSKCPKVNVRCYWSGICHYRRQLSQCRVKRVNKKCTQSLCCKWSKVCRGRRCYQTKKKCRWSGKRNCTHKSSSCNMRKNCSNGVRNYCCNVTKTCKGRSCKSSRKCFWKGVTVRTYSRTKCYWHTHRKNYKYQRRCCTVIKVKRGFAKATVKSRKCKWVGKYIVYKYRRTCRKHKTRNSVQKHCCQYAHKCETGKRCKLHKRKCGFVGPKVTYQKRKHCRTRRFKQHKKACSQQACCYWIRKCVNGRNCRPINKKCRNVGGVTKVWTTKVCGWKRINKNLRKRKCCWFKNFIVPGVRRTKKKIRCSFTGESERKIHRKKCKWAKRGRYWRQQRCCTWTDVACRGRTQKKNYRCGFTGKRYYKRVYRNVCNTKVYCKKNLHYRRQCCNFTRSCVGKKCIKHNEKCKWVGKTHNVRHHTVCKFKRFGGYHKKKHCCYYTKKCSWSRNKNKASCRVVKRRCKWTGKAIKLSRTYYKKQRWCGLIKRKTVKRCCYKLTKCVGWGRKYVCKLQTKYHKCRSTKIKVNTSNICISSGDPHYRGFDKKKFNFYRKGDYVLLKTKTVTVHTRTKVWGRTSVNTNVAVKLNSVNVVESVSETGRDWLVNKKKLIHLKNGQTYKLPAGGRMRCVNDKKVYLYSAAGDLVDLTFNRRSRGPQKGFINVIIKAKSNRGADGLCASRNFIKAGKGLFIKYVKGSSAPKEKACTQAKLKIALAKCKRVGCRTADLHICAIDVCNGIPATAEREVEKEVEKIRSKPGICYSTGDPHYRGFDKKKFNFYGLGDYVLLKTKTVTVHTRQKKWGRTSVNSNVAIKLNGRTIVESVSETGRSWLINKKKLVHLRNGQTYRLSNGAKIKCVNDKKVYVYSSAGDLVDLTFNRRSRSAQLGFVNVIIKAKNILGADGLCASRNKKKAGRGLFRKYVKGRSPPKGKACTQAKLRKAMKKCKAARVKDLDNCAVDVCNGLPANAEREVEKEIKKVKKKYGICYSTGDPHYRGFDRKKFNFYGLGDFLLVKTDTVTVHTRQGKWKNTRTSVNTNVAVKLSKRAIVESVSETGRDWLINKKKLVHLNKGQTYNLGSGARIKRVNNVRVYLYSSAGDLVDLTFNRRKYVNVIVKAKNILGAEGLCASRNSKKAGRGLFRKYVKGKSAPKGKACTQSKLNAAFKKCKAVGCKTADLGMCAIDVCNGLPARGMVDIEREVEKIREQ